MSTCAKLGIKTKPTMVRFDLSDQIATFVVVVPAQPIDERKTTDHTDRKLRAKLGRLARLASLDSPLRFTQLLGQVYPIWTKEVALISNAPAYSRDRLPTQSRTITPCSCNASRAVAANRRLHRPPAVPFPIATRKQTNPRRFRQEQQSTARCPCLDAVR